MQVLTFTVYLFSVGTARINFTQRQSDVRIAIPRCITSAYRDRYKYYLAFLVKYTLDNSTNRRRKMRKLTDRYFWSQQEVLNPPKLGELYGEMRERLNEPNLLGEERPAVGVFTLLQDDFTCDPYLLNGGTHSRRAFISYRLTDPTVVRTPSSSTLASLNAAQPLVVYRPSLGELFSRLQQPPRRHCSPSPTVSSVKVPAKKCTTTVGRSTTTPSGTGTAAAVVVVCVCIGGLQGKTYTDSFSCLLCELNCGAFKTMITHMRHSHGRLSFNGGQVASSSSSTSTARTSAIYHLRIDLNRHFDPSTSVNIMPKRGASGQAKPKTAKYTCLVSNELRNYQVNFNEQCQSDYPLKKIAKLAKASPKGTHVYYSSKTCRPKLPSEMEHDSDDDMDLRNDWGRMREYRLDFSDVEDANAGEKAMAKMWSIFMLKTR